MEGLWTTIFRLHLSRIYHTNTNATVDLGVYVAQDTERVLNWFFVHFFCPWILKPHLIYFESSTFCNFLQAWGQWVRNSYYESTTLKQQCMRNNVLDNTLKVFPSFQLFQILQQVTVIGPVSGAVHIFNTFKKSKLP